MLFCNGVKMYFLCVVNIGGVVLILIRGFVKIVLVMMDYFELYIFILLLILIVGGMMGVIFVMNSFVGLK